MSKSRRAPASSTSRRLRESGASRLFFVDRYGETGSIYDVDFDYHPDWQERTATANSRLTYIDHLTHNVNRSG